MNSLTASSYFYEPFPSFFTWAEIPVRKLHEARNCRGEISLPNLMMRVVVYPLTICAAPFTMLSDMILGVAEIAFAYYKGCDTDTLKSIALKKFVASPAQHLTFMTINGAGCFVATACITLAYHIPFIYCLPFSGWLTIFTYPTSQQVIGTLPKWTRPEGFSIFIDGGASDLDGSKYTQQFDKDYQKYEQERRQKYDQEWLKFARAQSEQTYQQQNTSNFNMSEEDTWDIVCQKIITELSLKESAGLTDYDRFKNGIIKKMKPRELLGLNSNFTAQELRYVFKKFSLVLHPDRNAHRATESTAITQCFFEAHHLLQEELKGRI
jgi:hypothetical protein